MLVFRTEPDNIFLEKRRMQRMKRGKKGKRERRSNKERGEKRKNRERKPEQKIDKGNMCFVSVSHSFTHPSIHHPSGTSIIRKQTFLCNLFDSGKVYSTFVSFGSIHILKAIINFACQFRCFNFGKLYFRDRKKQI